MQPYINPYLFSNPYISGNGNNMQAQPMSYPQPQSNFQQAAGIAGRYVNDFNEITANDVPMNGSPAIFAKNDRSEIQMREWSPNGQIVSTVYRAVAPTAEAPAEQPFDPRADLLEPILERINQLENKLNKLPKTAAKEKAE